MSLRLSPKIIGGTLAAVVAAAMAFVQPWEGSEPVAYQDVVGVTTACTGHIGPEVVLGRYYDEYQCEKWFKQDITTAAGYVQKCIDVPLTINEATALTSGVFNIGPSLVCGSTLQALANSGEPPRTWCAQLLRWVHAKGRKIQGLVNRRNAEYRLCMKA